MPQTKALDKLDRKLLQLVQIDNRSSAEALGLEVGLSTASVQRRLKRLRDQKIITNDVSIVDQSLLGYQLQVVTHIQIEKETNLLIKQFQMSMGDHDCVQQVLYVAGEFDFVVILIARDVPHYEEIADALFLSNDNVKSFTSSIVMKASLHRTAIPTNE